MECFSSSLGVRTIHCATGNIDVPSPVDYARADGTPRNLVEGTAPTEQYVTYHAILLAGPYSTQQEADAVSALMIDGNANYWTNWAKRACGCICPADANYKYYVVETCYYPCPNTGCYTSGINVESVSITGDIDTCPGGQTKKHVLSGPWNNPCSAGDWLDLNPPAWYTPALGDSLQTGWYDHNDGWDENGPINPFFATYTSGYAPGYDAGIENYRVIPCGGDCSCPHWFVRLIVIQLPNGFTLIMDIVYDEAISAGAYPGNYYIRSACWTYWGPYNDACAVGAAEQEQRAILDSMGLQPYCGIHWCT